MFRNIIRADKLRVANELQHLTRGRASSIDSERSYLTTTLCNLSLWLSLSRCECQSVQVLESWIVNYATKMLEYLFYFSAELLEDEPQATNRAE